MLEFIQENAEIILVAIPFLGVLLLGLNKGTRKKFF